MNTSGRLTSGWKEATRLDHLTRQVASFLFPSRRLIARLMTEGDAPSVTLWKDGNQCCLVYLTDQALREENLADILRTLSVIYNEGIISNDSNSSRVLLNVFSPDLHLDFLSKLHFFSCPIQTYEWLFGENEKKEAILIQEVTAATKKPPPKDLSFPEGVKITEGERFEPISSEELSAFVELGMDLRKIRQTPIVS